MTTDTGPATAVHEGLFNRAINLFHLIEGLRGVPSDEETDGLLRLLPKEVRHNLGALLAPDIRPAAMPFFRMLMDWLYAARGAQEQGKKVVLVPFNFPPELVLAFDNAVPLTTEVLTTLAAVALQGGGERYWEQMMALGLPDHICSSNSIEVGSLLCGQDLVPDAIISAAPGACDVNAKIHELAANLLGVPQLVLEKPVDDTDDGRRQYALYFGKLIADLEDLVHERLDENRLRRLLTGANRCTELYWELYDLHRPRPCPVPGLLNLLLVPVRFCAWGSPAAIETLEVMVQLVRQRLAEGIYPAPAERARVLWSYTSYYFNIPGLYTWMEKKGYTFLSDVLNLYAPRPFDLTSMDTMIQGMIDAAWDYPMNRQMGSSSMSMSWVRDVLQVCRELDVDCIVHSGHDACKQSWSVVSILGDELRKRANLPLLVLHGDSWRKTTTPISVIQDELAQFIETVVAPRSPKLGRRRRRRKLQRRT